MTRRPPRRRPASPAARRGAVTVEYAVCLSLMLGLIFFGLDAARAMTLRHTLQNAAYEGARVCAVPGADAEEGRAAAAGLLQIAGAGAASITVTPPEIRPEDKTVTVRIELDAVAGGCVLTGIFTDTVLSGECTLRTERHGL